MRLTRLVVPVIAVVCAVLPTAADAADYCIGIAPDGVACVDPAGTTPSGKLTSALAEADVATEETRVFLGPGTYEGQFTHDGASRVAIQGTGPDTVLAAADSDPAFAATTDVALLDLTLRTRPQDPAETVADLSVAGGDLERVTLVGAAGDIALDTAGGTVRELKTVGANFGVRAGGNVDVLDSQIAATGIAVLASRASNVTVVRSVVESTGNGGQHYALWNLGGEASVEGSVLRTRATSADAQAIKTECETSTGAGAVTGVSSSTVVSAAPPGVRGVCQIDGFGSVTVISNSILAPGTRPSVLSSGTAGATITLQRSRWDGPQPGDPTTAIDTRTDAPGFVSAEDLHLRPDSPLVDALETSNLTTESLEGDADGTLRVLDADGDGTARPDMGAYETLPPAGPSTAGNVLVNGDADTGPTSIAPPGWTVTGSFQQFLYFPFGFLPSPQVAAAFGGGQQLFVVSAATQSETGTQTSDLTARAGAIDGPGSVATLSGLLGAYEGSGDVATVTATFLDAGGQALGELRIGPVTADELGSITSLARRTATGPVPVGSRSVRTVIRLADQPGGDGGAESFADELSLTFADNPAPDPGPAGPGSPAGPGPGPGSPAGPGSAVTPGATSPKPAPYRSPALRGGTLRLDAKGRVAVRLACPVGAVGRCVGRLSLTRTTGKGKRKRTVRLAKATVAIATGKTQTVKLQLSRAGRRAVRGAGIKAVLQLASKDTRPGAKNATTTAKVRLKPAR